MHYVWNTVTVKYAVEWVQIEDCSEYMETTQTMSESKDTTVQHIGSQPWDHEGAWDKDGVRIKFLFYFFFTFISSVLLCKYANLI